MQKRRIMSLLLAASLAAASLTACGGGGREGAANQAAPAAEAAAPATEEAAPAADTASAGGFEEGATIGISLPWLGTQNWKEAETMFTEQLSGIKILLWGICLLPRQ